MSLSNHQLKDPEKFSNVLLTLKLSFMLVMLNHFELLSNLSVEEIINMKNVVKCLVICLVTLMKSFEKVLLLSV